MLQENLRNYDKVVKRLRFIYERKNTDYGDSFNISLDKFGVIAYVVRAGDKMHRIEKLISREALVDDESFEDTIRDLANYSIMTLMWLESKKEEDKEVTDATETRGHHTPGGY